MEKDIVRFFSYFYPMIKPHNFSNLLTQFINQGISNKRKKQNGGRLSKSTLSAYINLKKIIDKYELKKESSLVIHDIRRANKRELDQQKRYWKKFYNDFSDFQYKELGHFDNYVGHNFKMIRTFFNWVTNEKAIDTGPFHKFFNAPKEDIPIVTLEPEQLNFLIHDKDFDDSLNRYLRQTKDLFVFGCTVALRYSDLDKLKSSNWERFNGKHYLSVVSKKTHTKTRTLLPDYAVDILKKYKGRSTFLLPMPHKLVFNDRIKRLLAEAGWTHEMPKQRMQRGKPVKIKKPNGKHYRFCDHFSSHSMRRTGITTMLRLGLEENLVRKVSGHAPGSKEFYRYVQLSQSFMDEELTILHHKMCQKTLKNAKK